MKEYFKNDEYWREHINKKLEEDIWIEQFREYFKNRGKCLDLGCGIGQYSKKLIEYGNEVVSADISDIALNEVKKFNKNIIKVDMQQELPFESNLFDIVFANLSIHYFSNEDTKRLLSEIKRILKNDGLFIGSVNGIQGLEKIKDTAVQLEKHFWFYRNKNIRLFDTDDLSYYLKDFQIIKIEEKETVRFEHKKNYIIFFAKK